MLTNYKASKYRVVAVDRRPPAKNKREVSATVTTGFRYRDHLVVSAERRVVAPTRVRSTAPVCGGPAHQAR